MPHDYPENLVTKYRLCYIRGMTYEIQQPRTHNAGAAVDTAIRSHLQTVAGQYAAPVQSFLGFLGKDSISVDSVERFRDHLLHELHRKPATVARSVSAVRTSIREAMDRPDVPIGVRYEVDRQLSKVKTPSKGTPAPVTMSAQQLQQFNAQAKPRAAALARFLYHTAARISEALQIRTDAIKADGPGRFRVEIIGKGSKPRTLRIPAAVLDECRQVFGDGPLLFGGWKRPAAANMIRREAARILEVDGISPHSFRHTAATTAAAAGVPVDAIADWLGHADASMTAAYYLHNRMTPDYLDRVWNAGQD